MSKSFDVVHPIGELDEQHSAILTGGDKHLAQTFDPLLFPVSGVSTLGCPTVQRPQLDLLQFGDAVNQKSHAVAKFVA